LGDKVRLKSSNGGERGIVKSFGENELQIQISTGELIRASANEITNYSLAARKAWSRMPQRRVGRPKGSTKTDRVSVTLRIDREIWEKFQLAEKQGKIKDRTGTINFLLQGHLKEIADKK